MPTLARSAAGTLVLAAWLVSSAQATTLEAVTIEDLARTSDAILIGRVVDMTATPTGPGGQPGIHTRVRIAPAEWLAGPPAPEAVVWIHGGRLGNRARIVHGQARFAVGEDVLLFLRDVNNSYFPTGLGRGKWRIDVDPAGVTASPSESLGADFGPAAPAVPLTGLVDRIVAARRSR